MPLGLTKPTRRFSLQGTSALRRRAETFIHELVVSTSPLPELPRLLTLRQVAQALAVSRRTVERLIAAGEFPRPIKIGNASRVPEDVFRAYLAHLQTKATTNQPAQ